MKKNLKCESEKKICLSESISKDQKIIELQSTNANITSELQSGSSKHIITRQELRDCEEDLENEIRENKNLQTTALSNQSRAQDCQDKLENEIEAKEKFQENLQSIRPL